MFENNDGVFVLTDRVSNRAALPGDHHSTLSDHYRDTRYSARTRILYIGYTSQRVKVSSKHILINDQIYS